MPGKPPYFSFYPADFAGDGVVEAMTTEQVGAYILLLCKAWAESPPGTIPDDDAVLARWTRLPVKRWRALKAGILAAFVAGDDGRYYQKPLSSQDGFWSPQAIRQLYSARKRAKALGAGGHLSRDEWEAIVRRHGGKCAYCGQITHRPVMDHKTPHCRGGRHDASNVVPACVNCNARKGSQTFEEFMGKGFRDAAADAI
jgi:uncharacterized protein YdaU (DUF1376 family)